MDVAVRNVGSSIAVHDDTLLGALLSGERFWPTEPQTVHDTGLPEQFVEALICRWLLASGTGSGRNLAAGLCLPLPILEPILARLRSQQLVAHRGSAPLNDYFYGLTDDGRKRAESSLRDCAYIGPAPVPLMDYVISVEAQAISDEPIRRTEMQQAFYNISVQPDLLDKLGPAVNSGSGLFLYGAPGNGKSTLARCITSCFGQEIWLPHAFIDGQEIIQLYDPAYHKEVRGGRNESVRSYDRRWLRVKRPTVVVGGELKMDALEIRHDRASKVSEAPLQLKSNCGCLLIDDFGRQCVSPAELLNRWIVPLENRHDYLTLRTGKKIQVPFEQLVIFSTNLDPDELVDEAFLRRIPYRIEITNPDEEEFHHLFRLAADKIGCEFNPQAVEHLLTRYYRPEDRPLRRCHPRDLLNQVRHFCTYNGLPLEMHSEYFDEVAPTFFTTVRTKALRPGTTAESTAGPAKN